MLTGNCMWLLLWWRRNNMSRTYMVPEHVWTFTCVPKGCCEQCPSQGTRNVTQPTAHVTMSWASEPQPRETGCGLSPWCGYVGFVLWLPGYFLVLFCFTCGRNLNKDETKTHKETLFCEGEAMSAFLSTEENMVMSLESVTSLEELLKVSENSKLNYFSN